MSETPEVKIIKPDNTDDGEKQNNNIDNNLGPDGCHLGASEILMIFQSFESFL
jgi:hypothetical protein